MLINLWAGFIHKNVSKKKNKSAGGNITDSVLTVVLFGNLEKKKKIWLIATVVYTVTAEPYQERPEEVMV